MVQSPPNDGSVWSKTERLDQNNEMIRVSADLIEKMIDLSGEKPINRSNELGGLKPI